VKAKSDFSVAGCTTNNYGGSITGDLGCDDACQTKVPVIGMPLSSLDLLPFRLQRRRASQMCQL